MPRSIPPHAQDQTAAGPGRTRQRLPSPGRITVGFLVFGVLWILLSDQLLNELVADRYLHDTIATAKGWIFVGITAGILFLSLSAARRRARAHIRAARDDAEQEVGFRIRWLHRYSTWIAAVVVFLCLILGIVSWIVIRGREIDRTRAEFLASSSDRVAAIKDRLHTSRTLADTLVAFFDSSQEITRTEFRSFSLSILRNSPFLWAMGWIKWVTDDEVADLVTQARAEGLPDFAMRRPRSDGSTPPAPTSDRHAITWFAASLHDGVSPLGIDAYADPARRAVLDRSRTSPDAYATPPIALFSDAAAERSFVLYRAKWPRSRPDGEPEGFMVLSFRVRDLIQDAVTGVKPRPQRIWIFDSEDPDRSLCAHETLFKPGSDASAAPAVVSRFVDDDRSLDSIRREFSEHVEEELLFAGRRWTVLCASAGNIGRLNDSWLPWTVPTLIFASGILLAIYIIALGKVVEGEQKVAASARDLAERNRLLAESEERLRLALECGDFGVWDLDLANNSVQWDAGFAAIHGRDPTILGGPGSDLRSDIHPADINHVSSEIRQAIDTTCDLMVNYRILWPDGSVRWLQSRARCVKSAEGTPVRLIGVVADITQQHLAQQAMHDMNDILEKRVAQRTRELEATNQELESFSYSVSHDLRAPLRAIDGFSRIVVGSADAGLTPESRRLLGIIRTNAARMAVLIDDLLAFSRLGRHSVRRVEVNMDLLVRDVVRHLTPESAPPRAAIHIEDLPACIGDPSMLKQVWTNLISNALKFTLPGPEASIRVYADTLDDQVVYWVSDTGVGFDMQYADKLFRVFQRLHRLEEFEGTGVGLAIVKRIVERHGGKVFAHSAVGEGARFGFTIPSEGNEGV